MYRHIQDVYLAVFEAMGHHLSLLLMSYNLRLVAFPDLLTMVHRNPTGSIFLQLYTLLLFKGGHELHIDAQYVHSEKNKLFSFRKSKLLIYCNFCIDKKKIKLKYIFFNSSSSKIGAFQLNTLNKKVQCVTLNLESIFKKKD